MLFLLCLLSVQVVALFKVLAELELASSTHTHTRNGVSTWAQTLDRVNDQHITRCILSKLMSCHVMAWCVMSLFIIHDHVHVICHVHHPCHRSCSCHGMLMSCHVMLVSFVMSCHGMACHVMSHPDGHVIWHCCSTVLLFNFLLLVLPTE